MDEDLAEQMRTIWRTALSDADVATYHDFLMVLGNDIISIEKDAPASRQQLAGLELLNDRTASTGIYVLFEPDLLTKVFTEQLSDFGVIPNEDKRRCALLIAEICNLLDASPVNLIHKVRRHFNELREMRV